MSLDSYEEDNLEIQILTKEYVCELTRIWKHLFTSDICKTNLGKLKQHARAFYQDLVTESLERQKFIEQEIDELKMESLQLSRLLNTNFEFPSIEATNDLPLIVIQTKMDKSLAELRECLKKRRDEIYDLLLEQESLCEELDEIPKELLADPLPTVEEIENFKFYLEELKELKIQRMDQISAMRRDIKSFMKILMAKPKSSEDIYLNCREIKLDKNTVEALKTIYDHYKSEVDDMREKIDIIRTKIDVLWDRLQTSPSSRKRISKHTEYSLRTFDILSEELQRLEELKRQNIKLFVDQARNDLRVWWEKTLKSEAEQNRFSPFTSTCYTDDLLELHEMELEELKNHYNTNAKIYELYEERKILWERMIALEAKENEPGRYKNRGGQLLKEEKERKTIACKLPKIENEISGLVKEFEKNERKPFLVYGRNILELMSEDWERKRLEKEQLTSARRNAITPAKNSSHLIKRTPISLKNTFSTTRTTPMTGGGGVGGIGNSMAHFPFSASKKRRMSSSNKNSPSAKRSLMQALASPSCFGKTKPLAMTRSANKITPSTLSTTFKTPTSSSAAFKTPGKRTKVIGTTIRRYSGYQKRKSLGKKGNNNNNNNNQNTNNNKVKVPQVIVHQASEVEEADGGNGSAVEVLSSYSEDTYDSFKKSIPPHSRSSTLVSSNPYEQTNKSKAIAGKGKNRMASMIEDTEEPTLLNLPVPTLSNNNPSSHNLNYSRRKYTKNLPILL